ncbi:MAG TPA: hypothetical protein DEH02_19490 [Bacteroidales bacterium]|nr:hypothetical protein [Bacteroidales bacterium]
MRKFFITLFFIIPFGLNSSKAQLIPHEWLEVIFEDSLGWVDSVIIGHSENASLGADTLFDEAILVDSIPSNFFVRVEQLPEFNYPVTRFMKKDIRYNDRACLNLGSFWPFFYIGIYNATYPVKVKIIIYRDSLTTLQENPTNCGCYNDFGWSHPVYSDLWHTVWSRSWKDTNNLNIGDSDFYDLLYNSNLVDILPSGSSAYIVEYAPWGIGPHVPSSNLKSDINCRLEGSHIIISGTLENQSLYKIFSLLGIEEKRGLINNNSIDISYLTSGVYFLTLPSFYQFKFVKL